MARAAAKKRTRAPPEKTAGHSTADQSPVLGWPSFTDRPFGVPIDQEPRNWKDSEAK